MLASVVDFKSRWVQPFSPSETHSGDFTLLSGAKKQVRMMPKHDPEFQYFKGTNFQAVKLNFYDAAMVVVLPDEDSTLKALVDGLTPDTWQTWVGQFHKQEGFLELPRFEINQQRDSMPVLEKMGMTLPFSDLGTFIPHVIGAMTVAGLAPVGVLSGFGVFLIATGLFYGLPLPVQPMKAVSAVILTGGLRPGEVIAAGMMIGAVLLVLGITG